MFFWFGEDISCLNEEDRAKKRNGKLGFVFQSFQLVNHLTALENVMLPLELARVGEAREIATEYLIKVKLENRINHFPKTLSGGEQQRVALARAFSIKPIFLFADEPTGSLDNFNGMLVKDLLFELQESNGTTLVIVTHDSSLAGLCRKSVKMLAGRIG